MALADDIIAVWEMNDASGVATDEVASNDLGQNNNPGTTTGKLGNARTLNGSNQVFIVSNPLVTALPLTLSIWFNPSRGTTNQNLVSGGIESSNNFAWGLYQSSGDKLGFFASDGSGSFDFITGSTTLTTDGSTWYHAIIVWRSATDRELYLDGVSEGTSSASRTVSGSADLFVVGAYAPTLADLYQGAVDQTCLWGRDLTSGDIAALYNAGAGVAFADWDAGGGAVEGSASITLGALTASATGGLALAGSASITLGALTSSAAGTLAIVGTASPTLATLTLSATGTVAITGSASATLGTLTVTATGTLSVVGESSTTLGALTLTAEGGSSVTGEAAITLDAATVSAAGVITITGGAGVTLGAVTVAGEGALPIVGTAGLTLGNLNMSAAGVAPIAGAASPTLSPLTLSAVGMFEIAGTLSATLGTMTLTAHGGGILMDPPLSMTVRPSRPLRMRVQSMPLAMAVAPSEPLAMTVSL